MIQSEMFALSSAFVHFVLVIILGGILIVEYFQRKKEFRMGIRGYILFLVFIFAFFIFDVYRNLITSSTLITWICLSLAILANILFISTSLKYWKHMNKKIFFFIPPFAIGIIVFEVLRLLQVGKYLEIYTAMSTLIATLFEYFIIVGFLISITRRKNEKS